MRGCSPTNAVRRFTLRRTELRRRLQYPFTGPKQGEAMSKLLWQPSARRIAESNLSEFQARLEASRGLSFNGYDELHAWSVNAREQFWDAVWDYTGIIASHKGETVLVDGDKMPGATWFPGARLNFAENLLRNRSPDSPGMIFSGEGQVERTLSFAEVYAETAALANAMRAAGVVPGDRVAGYVPNMPEATIAMLATTSIGAVWSSCSPDFGVQGVLDRFGQIEPKVFICADGYFYAGKRHDSLDKATQILARLPSVRQTVVIAYTADRPDVSGLPEAAAATHWDEFCAGHDSTRMEFERLPFNHPLYIMYSSGTTGVPKCIVHGAGGTLLQHLKEHRLHADMKPGDRLMYFTTCGWMMWNWLVSGLANETTLLLYDGSPFHPDGNVLFDFADKTGMNVFGTSAKFIDAVKKAGLAPMQTHDLSTVKAMLSTGSPLVPESFDFVYDNIKRDICLSSISGGTDIISCFVLGNPTLPVHSGEIQCKGLGMDVAVFDDAGQMVVDEKGELVCTQAFPSMPVGFWNDPGGRKYHAAYFDKFDNVWCHGDYVSMTDRGTMSIYGRSDAVLNPGGVRIGTAEIYRQVEQLDDVVEALVVGQDWDGDVRVVLFLVLKPGLELSDDLQGLIRKTIRANASPRHVPARILQVADIPRTKSGKIVELAVREVVHGRPVKNKEALANPEALENFSDRPELNQ